MATPDLSDVLTHAEDVLHRNMDDETVLVDLRTGTYFGLNPAGSYIWGRLDGATPLASVLEGILGEFEVDEETARADLLRIAAELCERDLVAVAAGDGAAA
jgi:hypothetical protein